MNGKEIGGQKLKNKVRKTKIKLVLRFKAGHTKLVQLGEKGNTMPRTSFGKTRPVDQPYAEYAANNWGEGGTVWRVLKTYKHSEAEAKDPHARWFVAGKSPGTYGSWEYGDMYARDIKEFAKFMDGDPQWRDEYSV